MPYFNSIFYYIIIKPFRVGVFWKYYPISGSPEHSAYRRIFLRPIFRTTDSITVGANALRTLPRRRQLDPFITPSRTHAVGQMDLPSHLPVKQLHKHPRMFGLQVLASSRRMAEHLMDHRRAERFRRLQKTLLIKHRPVFFITDTARPVSCHLLPDILSKHTHLFHRLRHVGHRLPIHLFFKIRDHMPSDPIPCIVILQICFIRTIRYSPIFKI